MTYRVLVADDEAPIRKLVARVCRELGWEVDLAADGDEALDLMKRGPHDVFLFDIKMSGLSGLELARRVTEYEEAPAVLIITGYPEVGTAVEAMKEGVLDYVPKPVEIDRLKDLLLRAAQYHDGRLRMLQAQREHEESVRNIEEANERFRAMLELGHDAIFLFNARTGEMADCNARACKQLGYTRQELLQASLMQIGRLPPFTDWDSLVNRLRKTRFLVVEGIQRTKTGVEFPVEISLSFAYLTSGEFITAVARDITERKRAEQALEEERIKTAREAAKLRSMIEGMEEGVVFASEADVITEVNDWFLELFQMPREMVVGTRLWDLDSDGIPGEFRSVVEEFRQGLRREGLLAHRDLKGRPVSIRVQPIFQDEDYRGVILNLIDVTELVEARKKAEQASQFKSEFLAQISYEVRTQLDGILGMMNALLHTDLSEEQRLLLETANDCATSINSLVNDIQDISRIEQRTLDMEPSDFDVREIVQEASGEVNADAEKMGMEVVTRFERDLPVLVRGYGDHLAHAIAIVLEDALHLLKSKTLILRVAQKAREGNRIRLLIAVSVSEDVAEESVQRTAYPGTDIRVSLLGSLLDMLHGGAWAETADGEIRRLCFDAFVEAPVETDMPSASANLRIGEDERKLRVLLVEDSCVSRAVAKTYIQRAGCEATVAESGEEALDILRREHFDLVLMDVEMPGMDGLEAVKRMREDPLLSEVPVVAVTAHALKEDRERFLRAGMDDCITKPVSPESIRAAIARWGTHRRPQRAGGGRGGC